jgi:hypothetical protein
MVAEADQVVERIGVLMDAGIDYVIVYIPGIAYDLEPLHRFESEVIPQVAGATAVHSVSR